MPIQSVLSLRTLRFDNGIARATYDRLWFNDDKLTLIERNVKPTDEEKTEGLTATDPIIS